RSTKKPGDTSFERAEAVRGVSAAMRLVGADVPDTSARDGGSRFEHPGAVGRAYHHEEEPISRPITYTHFNEAELLRAAESGRSAAMEELLTRARGPIHNVINKFGLSPAEQEDVAIDAELRLWGTILKGTVRAGTFYSFARTIARNCIIDLLR